MARLDDELRARVHEVIRLTPKIVEIVIQAPIAARAFKPGQFYRLQNYETLAPRIDGTTLAMEGLALTGAAVDREQGLLSTIVLEMGGSSDLCALLKPGEPVILMGPTGTPTETPAGETVLLVGGGLGNAVLFSIAAALRAQGSRVLYFAGYKTIEDRYKVEDIERAADCRRVVLRRGAGLHRRPAAGSSLCRQYRRGDRGLWLRRSRPGRDPAGRGRPDHRDRLRRDDERGRRGAPSGAGALFPAGAPGDRFDQFTDAVHDEGDLRAVPADAIAIRSPATETVVFSCFNQDQEMDQVDFPALRRRLSQNGAQEKLTKLWIDRCLHHLGERPALAAE